MAPLHILFLLIPGGHWLSGDFVVYGSLSLTIPPFCNRMWLKRLRVSSF